MSHEPIFDFLRYKILLLALILTGFCMCLYRAVRLVSRGQTKAAIPYIVIGISGIFGSLLLGPPIIFGLFR